MGAVEVREGRGEGCGRTDYKVLWAREEGIGRKVRQGKAREKGA